MVSVLIYFICFAHAFVDVYSRLRASQGPCGGPWASLGRSSDTSLPSDSRVAHARSIREPVQTQAAPGEPRIPREGSRTQERSRHPKDRRESLRDVGLPCRAFGGSSGKSPRESGRQSPQKAREPYVVEAEREQSQPAAAKAAHVRAAPVLECLYGRMYGCASNYRRLQTSAFTFVYDCLYLGRVSRCVED